MTRQMTYEPLTTAHVDKGPRLDLSTKMFLPNLHQGLDSEVIQPQNQEGRFCFGVECLTPRHADGG